MQKQGDSILVDGPNTGLNVIRGANVLTKIKIVRWRLLKDSLSVRKQLVRRGIIERTPNACCGFCQLQEENLTHLFLNAQS